MLIQKYRLKDLLLSRPLTLSICLMSVTMVIRLLDIFVFGLDDLLGEIILSKIIGFIIVILFVKIVGDNISNIGFNINNGRSIFQSIIFILIPILIMLTKKLNKVDNKCYSETKL